MEAIGDQQSAIHDQEKLSDLASRICDAGGNVDSAAEMLLYVEGSIASDRLAEIGLDVVCELESAKTALTLALQELDTWIERGGRAGS